MTGNSLGAYCTKLQGEHINRSDDARNVCRAVELKEMLMDNVPLKGGRTIPSIRELHDRTFEAVLISGRVRVFQSIFGPLIDANVSQGQSHASQQDVHALPAKR